jgi:hypothetical protein
MTSADSLPVNAVGAGAKRSQSERLVLVVESFALFSLGNS